MQTQLQHQEAKDAKNAQGVKQKMSQASSEVKRNVDDVAHEAGDLFADAKTRLTEKFGDVKESAYDFVQNTSKSINEFADQALKQGAAYGKEVEKVISRRPLTAIAVAAGMGAILASVFAGRSHRSLH